jgi:Polyketide cyclase / dehydrase and lipid transport
MSRAGWSRGSGGEWTFTPDGDGTVVRWTYEFKPLQGCLPLVRLGLAPAWKQYMARGLSGAITEVERQRR